MKMYKLGALAVLPFFLLGCESPEDDTTLMDEDRTTEERAHQIGDTETVNLGDVEDSGVTGDARFTVITQNETEVLVELEDAAPNATYQVAIHQGTCDMVGQERHALQTIQTNEQGNGASSTTLSVQLANVMDGNHVVAVHGQREADATMDRTDTELETDVEAEADETVAQAGALPVACGDISEHGTGLGW
jgi:hypothetical protein